MVRFKNIVYQKLMNFIYNGLVHGDFNEFNILLTINNSNIVVIDFPQMISIEHKEAENYLKKDVKCVKIFKAFGYIKEKKNKGN